MMQDYQPAADLLKDRIILVTGAGDGIGRAAVRQLGAHGATVILLGRTIPKLEQVYDELEQANEAQVPGIARDVIHLPANRHHQHLIGHRAGQTRTPEMDEIRLLKQVAQAICGHWK